MPVKHSTPTCTRHAASSPGSRHFVRWKKAARDRCRCRGLYSRWLAAGAYFFMNRHVTVPDLRGDTIAVGYFQAAGSHLKVGQTTVRQDSTVDPNVVLSQYPPSDERVKSGTVVDLVVSGATAQVEVPTITGQTLDNALHTLAEHQLVVGDVQRQARVGVDSRHHPAAVPAGGRDGQSSTARSICWSPICRRRPKRLHPRPLLPPRAKMKIGRRHEPFNGPRPSKSP